MIDTVLPLQEIHFSSAVSGVTPAGDSGASGTGSGTGTKAAAQPCPIETVTRDLVRKGQFINFLDYYKKLNISTNIIRNC